MNEPNRPGRPRRSFGAPGGPRPVAAPRRAVLRVAAVLWAALVSACAPALRGAAEEPFDEESGFLLGTVVTLRVYGPRQAALIREAFRLVESYEAVFSRNLPDSDVSRLNRSAGLRPQAVSPATLEVIEEGLRYGELSDGLFDLTIGPLVDLWAIGGEDPRVPSDPEIQRARELVDYRKVVIDHEAGTVFLPVEGMALDLGAIAKGYVADRVVEFLHSRGVRRGIMNLGGNVHALGTRPGGDPFRIGIQNPSEPRGAFIGIAEVSDASVVTSGVYERYFEEAGRRYHHLLNPYSGFPVDNELEAVSIIASRSLEADALSTVVFCLGLEAGRRLVESLDGVEAIFLTAAREVVLTRGVEPRFTLTSGDYVQ